MVRAEAPGVAIEAIEAARFLTAEQMRDLFFNYAVEELAWLPGYKCPG